MTIGKILFFIIFAIIVIVGISIALSQTKGDIKFNLDPENKFLKSVFWFNPENRADKKEFVETDLREIEKVEVNVSNEGGEVKVPEKPKPIPPAGFSESQLSPLWGEVVIKSVTPANPANYSKLNGFTLSAGKTNEKIVFISDWKIKSNRGTDLYIPKGISDYGFSGIGNPEPIGLRPNEYAVFYSTQSANVRNFRLNKCIGYLGNTYSFTPALPKNCPLPYEKSELITLTGACQNFIRSLSKCKVPTANDKNRFANDSGGLCREILDRFNYGYCYEKHKNDADFFAREWRVWLGIPMPFDTSHDRLLLFDNAGLLVDEYVY